MDSLHRPSYLFSFYLLAIGLLLFLVLYLFFIVSEDVTKRERLCRYLDAPEIVYPANFDEDKIRDLVEKGFTFKHLGGERDWNVRVILVPIAVVLLSPTILPTTFTRLSSLFGM